MYYTDEQYKEIYKLIKSFIAAKKLSNRMFAQFADMPPTTFQNMLNNESKIKPYTLRCIISAMVQLANTDDLKKTLNALIGICSTNKQPTSNEQEEHLRNIQRHIVTTGERDSVILDRQAENLNCAYMLEAFDQLNEKGQHTAMERVMELTKIADYRKDKD